MTGLYRCAGDILFDDNPLFPGKIASVQLKQYSETSNFLQYQRPLTPQNPYFSTQVKTVAPHSKIIVGIANTGIVEDAQPGSWNNTVGFHSNSGRCLSSHNDIANTEGEALKIGDIIGVLVTHFGLKMSTVMFLKNNKPIATRYLFESDHKQFLPTISLENGPIDLGIIWPEAVTKTPQVSDRDMTKWLKHPEVKYVAESEVFMHVGSLPEVAIQGPLPLSLDFEHFEVIVLEASNSGVGPSIAIATCSPLKPSPTCLLLRDFFRWLADGETWKVAAGQKIGIGIHYHPDAKASSIFNDKQQQLVMCYVTLDTMIIYWKMLIQPEGGFYPLILLNKEASKIQIDINTNRHAAVTDRLDDLYRKELVLANEITREDTLRKEIDSGMFNKSHAILLDTEEEKCHLRLRASDIGIHVIQFQRHLTPDHSYFCIEIGELDEDSVITAGVASHKFPLNKYPGKHGVSTGWVSRDGKLFFNEKSEGNTEGIRFEKGDIIGIQVHSFGKKSSVILFMKNFRPIGTRFVTVKNLFPTIAFCGNGYSIEVDVYWQNQISLPPAFNVCNLDHWCLPPGGQIDYMNNIVLVEDHIQPMTIQAPYPLKGEFNHFEIQLIDEFGEDCGVSPPLIVLTAAGIQKQPESTLWQDSIRFWATDAAQDTVAVGDIIGWGVMHIKSQARKRDKLVITYLTINRTVRHTKVLYEPPGGFYPLIVLPLGVNRVKIELGALNMGTSPISKETVTSLLLEAETVIALEKQNKIDDTITNVPKAMTDDKKILRSNTRKKNKAKSLRDRLMVKWTDTENPDHRQRNNSDLSAGSSIRENSDGNSELSRTCNLI